MKLRKLRIASFAAIRDLEVELGPGLNVLYGPNDLGKIDDRCSDPVGASASSYIDSFGSVRRLDQR